MSPPKHEICFKKCCWKNCEKKLLKDNQVDKETLQWIWISK